MATVRNAFTPICQQFASRKMCKFYNVSLNSRVMKCKCSLPGSLLPLIKDDAFIGAKNKCNIH